MDLQLGGKTALVTGASQGIGRASAKSLAAEGVQIAIAARRGDLLNELANEIVDAGHLRPIVIPHDIMAVDTHVKQGDVLIDGKLAVLGDQVSAENKVTVNNEITDDFIAGLSAGVPILGVVTKACKVTKESNYVFRITLVQGLNRQIRRMCKHFKYSVERLERVRIMHIGLNGLKTGQWRVFTTEERQELFQALEKPSSI
jgi:16S rRNA U516 pseudouridylate synthase RsuA-like enzyme